MSLPLTGVPKKVKRLIDNRTKGFCSIINFSFDLNRKYSNLDFETKFAQIRYELTDIHQFQNDKLISTFRILPIFGILIFTMHFHQIICHCEEIFAEDKLK